MFTAIPVPHIEWTKKNTRFLLCAFPLIGLLIASCQWGWWQLAAALHLHELLRGAGLCLIPALITGGIHLDGYADTCDALASHQNIETRQKILKDPHLGAFAAIRLCVYFVAQLALWTASASLRFPVLLGIFCLSRSLSGLALTTFPLREGSGLARYFAEASDREKVRRILLIQVLAMILILFVFRAGEAALAAIFVFCVYWRVCKTEFGGLSGDLAGWFLQKAELWMLAALLIRETIGKQL